MPCVRKDGAKNKARSQRSQRGIYVHNPPQPVAVSTTSLSHTRLHKHRTLLPPEPAVEANNATSENNGMDLDTLSMVDEELNGSTIQPPPCVSGIKVRSKAKRYNNSVSFYPPIHYTAIDKLCRICLLIPGSNIESSTSTPTFLSRVEVLRPTGA